MKWAFSTLGLPGLPLPSVLRLAGEHGWDGVELRCAPGEPVHLGLGAAERAALARQFGSAGVLPLAVCSYVGIAAPGEDGPVLTELTEHLRLATDLGAPYVRVFPRGEDATAVRRLRAVAPVAGALGVRVLVETHDTHRSARAVARLAAAVDSPAVGGLWDLLHTHLAGETPAESLAALAPWLGYTQVKDVASTEDLTPVPLGSGILPIAACLSGLGPDAWVSWEYEAPWHPAAAPFAPLLARPRPGPDGPSR
ncbi:sugar phosphate isomerase/epimerase family protein [Kitasatospora sp. NPDC096147]|uniref:sugar phosphate isomerase/epimerase family protein n=1 Tax=Kitasatospora sp. NPDC096147 TaxID=3364093 RepID=UPI0038143F6E